MAAVHKIAGGFVVSISTLAEEFQMSRETVSKRLDRCGVQPVSAVRGWPTYRLRDAVKAILGVSVERRDMTGPDGESVNPADLPPGDRLAWMRSESERLKVEAAKGELIPAAKVEAELASVLKLLVQALETLPDRLERECALPPDAVERVGVVLGEVRASLHESLSAGDDAEAA